VCGWKFHTGGGNGPSIVKPAVRPKIQAEVDLGVTVDRTGSSKQFEIGIPMSLETILRQVNAKARSVKCWLGSHGDLDEGQQFILHNDGGTPEQAIEDVRKIVFNDGGDPAEHHLDAIETLLKTVPWTAKPTQARGAILAFLTADTKPAKSGITAKQLGEEIKKQGVFLYLICEPTPTLKELVDAAEGLMFEITNSPDAAELQKIASQVAASIVVLASSGKTEPMTESATR
jgi:hypothetical protein